MKPRSIPIARSRGVVIGALLLLGARHDLPAQPAELERIAGSGEERATRATFSPPTGDLALRDALAAALVANPSLPASSLEVRAREAETLQAGFLPNPELTTEVEDFGGSETRSGFDASQTTVSLSQLIELGGKRAARIRLAHSEAELARWDYEALRIDLLSRVAKAFLETLAAQERLALSEELLRIAERSVETVAGTVRSGAVSPVEEGRARVTLSQVRIENEQRARELEQARIALAATWGSSAPSFASVQGDFPAVREPTPIDVLIARIQANPDLARWTSELAQREASLSLARARSVPDVTVSAGGRYYQDEQTGGVVALFSVPLPVFDRRQGEILAAETRLRGARFDQRAVEVSLKSELSRAHETLTAAYHQATELRDRTLPEARKVFEGARDAYARGLFRYLEVLDAQRTLFQLRADYVGALLRYHEIQTDISRLTGAEPGSSNDVATRNAR